MTPTTDTLQGWLVIACLAVALVCLGAAALAAWDAAWKRHRTRLAFDAELARLRQDARLDPAYFTFDVYTAEPHHHLRVKSDRMTLSERDLIAIEAFAQEQRWHHCLRDVGRATP